jgi:hypothetical protein
MLIPAAMAISANACAYQKFPHGYSFASLWALVAQCRAKYWLFWNGAVASCVGIRCGGSASFPLQGVATALCSSSIGAHAASSPSSSLSSLIPGAVPKKFGDVYAPPSRHLDHGKSRNSRREILSIHNSRAEARQWVHDGAFLGYLCADAGIVTKCGARPSRQSPAPASFPIAWASELPRRWGPRNRPRPDRGA